MATDAELQDVKRELSKLKGYTLRTLAQKLPNHIENISDSEGFCVLRQRTGKSAWVSWNEVLGKYKILRRDKTLIRSKDRDNGAFVAALLATLTTVDFSLVPQRTLHYALQGLPVRLRRPV